MNSHYKKMPENRVYSIRPRIKSTSEKIILGEQKGKPRYSCNDIKLTIEEILM